MSRYVSDRMPLISTLSWWPGWFKVICTGDWKALMKSRGWNGSSPFNGKRYSKKSTPCPTNYKSLKTTSATSSKIKLLILIFVISKDSIDCWNAFFTWVMIKLALLNFTARKNKLLKSQFSLLIRKSVSVLKPLQTKTAARTPSQRVQTAR